MRFLKFLIILVLIVIVLLAVLQFVVNESASDTISESIRTSFVDTPLEDVDFSSMRIDLLGGKAAIQDLSLPIENETEGTRLGNLDIGEIEVDFSYKDATSFLGDNPSFTGGSITITDPSFVGEEHLAIPDLRAASVTVDFSGRIEQWKIAGLQSGQVSPLLQEHQQIHLTVDDLVIDVPGNDLVTIFLAGLTMGTEPISGQELAAVGTMMFPSTPLVKQFFGLLRERKDPIDRKMLGRVITLGMDLVGMQGPSTMVTDGDIIIESLDEGVGISGSVQNPIGDFTIAGIGLLDESAPERSKVTSMTIQVSITDEDLKDLLGRSDLTLELQRPATLNSLYLADFLIIK